MSLFGHTFVVGLLLVFCQITKSENNETTPMPPEHINLNHTSGTLFFKISIEKAECMRNETKDEPESSTKPGRRSGFQNGVDLGTETNPAATCIAFNVNDDYYIYPENKFKVHCDRNEEATCVIINENLRQNKTTLNSSAITLRDELWLSETRFEVASLFSKLQLSQISYLQSTSTKVIQRIKYYYKTKELITTPEYVKSLQALLWNDHLIGSEITKKMPLKFTNEISWCWDPTDEWVCTDITIEDNSNKRLPTTDFYIEEVREKANAAGIESVQLYFELLELCFY